MFQVTESLNISKQMHISKKTVNVRKSQYLQTKNIYIVYLIQYGSFRKSTKAKSI